MNSPARPPADDPLYALPAAARPHYATGMLLGARDFADEHGILDWGSRKAGRQKQKQREILAKDLRRFFRIDGDPFVLEGNGWRARFGVSVR